MDIYRSGNIIKTVHPADDDKVVKKVMGENTLTISTELPAPFDFAVGDYLLFSGEKYTLNISPKFKKVSENQFLYDLLFEGIEYELRKVQHLYYTANIVYVGGSDFSLMGNAELQARIIVENLNRVQSGWSLGTFPSTTAKNLTFSSNNCLEAITKIATEFATEYWIGSDKTVNIGKRGDILPVSLQYGNGNGLYTIERDNVNSKDIVTRLYAFGSASNLPKGYRSNAKRLQLSTAYIERNVSAYGVIESSEIFEDIKPERTGTITAVGDIFSFSDSSMDFDLNAESGGNTLYLIPGTPAKIHFQTGDLAGYEFELASYVHATKTFKVNKFTDEVAYDLPNSTLKPAVGDKYVIIDIYMPQSYVDDAEARLLVKAQESLNQNSEPNVTYKVTVDPLFIKDLGIIFKSGDYVSVVDSQLGIDRNIRIVSISRNINKTNVYDFDLADTVEPSLTTQIITTLENQDIVIKMNRLKDPARARRSWKVVQELQNAIYDQDGYFDPINIKPASIETNMLTVGSKGNQFYTDCYFQANYGGNKNSINVGDGVLSHFTIEDAIRNWAITGLTETLPDDNLRYIFIRCLKASNIGYVVLSATHMSIDDGTYYNFFSGVLSSVIDNARQISLLFGFTSINGRFIKTGRIQNGDGSRYWDVDTGDFKGKATFESGSSGYSNIADKPDLSVYPLKTYVDALGSSLQSQIDGQIISWFDQVDPTTANTPASDWTTDVLKQQHANDTYTNLATGGCWRWVYENSAWKWGVITDTATQAALAAAAKAQDTADGKRRVFTSQPTSASAYDVGDLWVNATCGDYTNELLTCNSAKAAGATFDITDWEKAAKYTDDTAVNNLVIGGRNLILNSSIEKSSGYNTNTWISFQISTLNTSVQYAISFDLKSSNGTDVFYVSLANSGLSKQLLGTQLTTSSMYKRYTFVITKSSDIITELFFANQNGWNGNSNNTGTIYVKNVKIELGNKATDWLPAPEDVDSSIATCTKTAIDGGLVTSGTILLGDGTTIKAGITGEGTAETSTRIWAGSDYAGRTNAPFRVLQNGEMFSTKGTIGGWTISTDKLSKADGDYSIELNSVNRILSFSYAGQEKVRIMGENIPILGALINPDSGTVYPGANYTVTENGDYSYLTPNSFTIPASTIKSYVNFNTESGNLILTIKVYLTDTSGNVIKLLGSLCDSSSGGWSNYIWLVTSNNIAPGTYKLKYVFTCDKMDYPFTLGPGSISDYLEYYQQVAGSILGKDGFTVFYSGNKFLYIGESGGYFLEARGVLQLESPNAANYVYINDTAVKLAGAVNMQISSKGSHPTTYRAVYMDKTTSGNGNLYILT